MVILITGAGRGLGTALTRTYLEEGNRVYALIRRAPSEELLALKEEFKDNLSFIEADVASTEDCNRAGAEFSEKVDILINNAAVRNETFLSPLEEYDLDASLAEYNVNSLGPLRIVKAFLPHMEAGSLIVNISSEAGSLARAWQKNDYGYCMSKTALNRGSVILAEYLKDRDIKVMCIHPGWVRTDMGGEGATYEPMETAHKVKEYVETYKTYEGVPYINYDGTIYPW